MECQPGFFKDVFENLVLQLANNLNMPDCALMMDAMAIRKQVIYDKTSCQTRKHCHTKCFTIVRDVGTGGPERPWPHHFLVNYVKVLLSNSKVPFPGAKLPLPNPKVPFLHNSCAQVYFFCITYDEIQNNVSHHGFLCRSGVSNLRPLEQTFVALN